MKWWKVFPEYRTSLRNPSNTQKVSISAWYGSTRLHTPLVPGTLPNFIKHCSWYPLNVGGILQLIIIVM